MSADPAPVKWKKRRRHGAPGVGGDNSRPAELSAALARCALRGALAHGCAYVRAEPYVARLLDRLCIGRVLRGAAAQGLPETDPLPPGAAAASAEGRAQGQARPPHQPPLLRLSMLEAVFLAHGLECLTLFDMQEPDEAATTPCGDPGAPRDVAAEDAAALAALAPPPLAAALRSWRAGGQLPESLAPLLCPPPPEDAAALAAALAAARAEAHAVAAPPRSDAHAALEADEVVPSLRRLSAEQIWRTALEAHPGFAPAYAAYLYCRARGWLVRSGLQYGADYVLYPRHPSQAHSSFCALVIPPGGSAAPQAQPSAADAVRNGFPCWPELQGLSRLCVQVNKGLLLLHVLEDAPGGDASAPGMAGESASGALERLRVVEVCVTRWNPNKGRLEAEVMGV